MKNIFLILLSFFIFSLPVLAEEGVCEECQKTQVPSTMPQIQKIAEKLNQQCGAKQLEVGEICKTSKGVEFKFLGTENGLLSYQDLKSGLIWEDRISDKVFFYDKAVEACESRKGRLPFIEEVEEAEEHGFREILPSSGHTYVEKWFIGGPKTIYTHDSYWAMPKEPLFRKRLGFKFKKGYAYKMARDYFDAWEVDGDANAFGTGVRCVRTVDKPESKENK